MNDKYGYDDIKGFFDKKFDDDTSFEAKMNEAFNEEYIKEGTYNGYNVREAALRDHESIVENSNFKVVSFDGDAMVGTKAISSENKLNKIQKTVLAVLVAAGLGLGTITFVDIAKHPEDYLTTHPDFDGTATISEVIDRTPENFGIGGR